MATIPTRVSQDLFDAARAAGHVHSRSATQQLDHWARIGRALETSPSVTHDAVARVLSGQASYDELSGQSQAVVRASWDDQISRRIASLNFADELGAAGKPWYTADADGNVVTHQPGPATA